MKSTKVVLILVAGIIVYACTETVSRIDIDVPTASTALVADTIPATDVLIETETNDLDSLIPKKYIYLTIDDAPLNGSRYLDSITLATQTRTNIFMVGNPINESWRFKENYEIMQKNPYIEVYNHSYSHANHRYTRYYKKPEDVLADFEKNQTEFNILHKIARLPGRNIWNIGERKKNYRQNGSTSADLLYENGYKVFGWDIEWCYDPQNYKPKQTIDQLVTEIEKMYIDSLSFTPNHVVLLMHDQMFAKVDDENDLGVLINRLKELGYTFECLRLYPD